MFEEVIELDKLTFFCLLKYILNGGITFLYPFLG